MLNALGRSLLARASAERPWTNVVGVARTLLALGTALTLAFNDTGSLFRPGVDITEVPRCSSIRRIGAFCVAPLEHLDLVRWLAVVILLVVATGFRPRLTALPHWWIAFSFQANAVVVDGGDQVTSILTLLLLPVALTDQRKWHWGVEPRSTSPGDARPLARLLALLLLITVRVQVAAIYFHAVAGKLSVPEWGDGTVLYYWFTDPIFGAPPWMKPLVDPLLRHPAIAPLTWAVLLLELSLAMALVMDEKRRRALLGVGIAFHAAIALVLGLGSFAFAMSAALVLHLRPTGSPFAFAWSSRRSNAAARARSEPAALPWPPSRWPARR